MATNVYLRPGHASPTTVVLRDPTQGDAAAANLTPLAGALGLTGIEPVVDKTFTADYVLPEAGALSLTSDAPTLAIAALSPTLEIVAGGLELSGDAPIVSNSGDVVERGQQPAGGSSRRRKQRKRYLIGERQYWADESELPGLILAVAGQPEKQPAPASRTRAKATIRAQEALKVVAEVATHPQQPTLLERLNALRAQFQQAENEILLRSLAIAAARLAEMENEDEELLLLAA